MEALKEKEIQQQWSTFFFWGVCQVFICFEQTSSSRQTSNWIREKEQSQTLSRLVSNRQEEKKRRGERK